MRQVSRSLRVALRFMMAAFMIVLLLAMAFPAVAAAQEGSGGSDPVAPAGTAAVDQGGTALAVMETDGSGIVIDISIGDVLEEAVDVEGQTFQALSVEGYAYTSDVGKPQLPAIRETIGIPDGASVQATVLDATYTTRTGYNVYPVQEPEFDHEGVAGFVIDTQFYSQDAFYPAEIVEISSPAVWRDVSVADLQVNPVTHNPATGEVRVYDHIKVQLDYTGGIHVAKTVAPKFASSYRSTILNYDMLGITEANPDYDSSPAVDATIPAPDGAELDGPFNSSIKLLSIRPRTTIPWLDVKPFLEWHKLRGIPYVSYGLVEPMTAATVKNLISNVYNSHPELEYVLLVGDIDTAVGTTLLPWQSNWDGEPGDYWYACLTGGATPDLYPEVAVGRLAVKNVTELDQQTAKIMTYADSPPAGSWVDRVLLMAHKEYAPGKYQGAKEEIRTATYSDGFSFHTAYGAAAAQGGDAATNADVNYALDTSRRGIVNYRGHGSPGSPSGRPWGVYWGSNWNTDGDEYRTNNAAALNNGDYTPVVFSISCLNNALDNTSNSLGEAFMKHDDGAVAFLGASRPSYTTPNHEFDKDLFDAIGNEGIYDIGWVLNDANTELVNRYGAGSTYTANARMYFWLGDPSMEIWTAAPRALSVSYPSTIQSSLTVTVRDAGTSALLQNALVTLSKGYSDIYTYVHTNSSGQATFSLTPASDGTLNVTVTKHNYLPHYGTTTIDTLAPSVTLSSPNGGEVWSVGSTHNILWSATDSTDTVASIDLYYSINGGLSYGTIATGEANDGSYPWTIPNTPSTRCRVKVVARDDASLTGEDISDDDFTIPEANISVFPTHIGVTLPQNTTWITNLRINNSGDEALLFNLRDIETTGGPYFEWVAQVPDPLPAGDNGALEAKVNDPDGLADIDTVRAWITQRPIDQGYMHDDGVSPDVTAGDGVYSILLHGTTMYGDELGLQIEAKDMSANAGHASAVIHVDVGDAGTAGGTESALSLDAGPQSRTYEVPVMEADPSSGATRTDQTTAAVDYSGLIDGLDILALGTSDNSYADSDVARLNALGANVVLVKDAAIASLTVADLQLYDVVYLATTWGLASSHIEAIGSAIQTYVNGGGGLVVGQSSYFTAPYTPGFLPYSLTYTDSFWPACGVTIVDPTHYITTGLTGDDMPAVGDWIPLASLDANYDLLAQSSVEDVLSLAVAEYGSGRIAVHTSFWPGSHVCGDDPDIVVERIMYWASQGVEGDCPWLSENPMAGSVAQNEYADIDVTVDTNGLAVGDYSAEIYIASNDPDENPTVVPVQLTVVAPIEAGDILFDETHSPSGNAPGVYSTSDIYADWVTLLEAWGFTVTTLTEGTITYDRIQPFCAVVIPEPTADYTDAENAAIQQYVNAGGGLLVLGEWGPFAQSKGIFPVVNELATPFGMTYNDDTIEDASNNDGASYWPLIPEFVNSIVGANVDNAVEYAAASVNAEGSAFPIAWGYGSAHTDVDSGTDAAASGTDAAQSGPSAARTYDVSATEFDPSVGDAPTDVTTVSVDYSGLIDGLDILALGAGSSTQDDAEVARLNALGANAALVEDAAIATLTAFDLQWFDVVYLPLQWGQSSTHIESIGATLQAFVNGGGGLVVGQSSNFTAPYTPTFLPAGYGFTYTDSSYPACGVTVLDPAHPITTGLLGDDMPDVYDRIVASTLDSNYSVLAMSSVEDALSLAVAEYGSGRIAVHTSNWKGTPTVCDSDPDIIVERVFSWAAQWDVEPPVMAASFYGSGRAMVIGDGNLFDNGDHDGDGVMSLFEFDNEKLGVNIIDWLCGAGAPERKPDLVITRKWEEPTSQRMYLHPVKPIDPGKPIGEPVGLDWDELYPNPEKMYNLGDWKDNGDRVLSPDDLVVLVDLAAEEKAEYFVDDMTITLVAPLGEKGTIVLDFTGGYELVEKAMVDPTGSPWHEIQPVFCQEYKLTEWRDAEPKGLSADDLIVLTPAGIGKAIETTVAEVSWDMIVSPVEPGNSYTVCYTVQNQGTATAPAGHYTSLTIDGSFVEQKVVPVALAPGQSYTDCFRTVVESTPPVDKIEVCADSRDSVDELNERNNCRSNTYVSCEPGLVVVKQVWDECTETWVDQIYGAYKSEVRFRIAVENTGDCCDLTKVLVRDTMSESLKYMRESATVNGKPWEPEISGNDLMWKFEVIKVGETIIIEFDAAVVELTKEPDVNTAVVSAWCELTETVLSDEDRAFVQPYIQGDGNMDGIIDGRDVIRVKKIILGLEAETPGADANGDCVIDGRDVIRVKKMILGIA